MNRIELEQKAKELNIKFPANIGDETLLSKIEEEEESKSKVVAVKRTSKCGNYTTKIKSIEEAARRSNLTVEDIEKALMNNTPAGGYTLTKAE